MFLNNVIYHGDCVNVMSEFPEKSVDLVVTSPPYDSLRTYNGSLEWSFAVFKGVAEGLVRVLKDGGVIVWIVNDATVNGDETGTAFNQVLHFKKLGLRLHDTMIWEKDGINFPDRVRYQQCFEYMFVMSKGKPKSITILETHKTKGYPNKRRTKREADGSLTVTPNNGKPTPDFSRGWNVWHVCSEKNNALGHPAPFPINLAKDHILSWSNPGDLVLDPFAGSGTTLLAAKQSGRNYVGIEKESIYKSMCDKRVSS